MCLKISDYLRMFHVERLSGVFHIRKYDLVHHSFLVGILFERFAKKEGIEISAQALSSVLHHDVFETVTGDLSYVVKNYSRTTKKSWEKIEDEMLKRESRFSDCTDEHMKSVLSPLQFTLFKSCDLFELWIFIVNEYLFGNHHNDIVEIMKRCEEIIEGYGIPSVIAEMYEYKKEVGL
ncbi:MAG TPA: HD domain-containing protein [Caldisericia bacterium]|jgi:5'-deoxynucleotidase YfbR-like HD superfamily hydrolase|nr:HD domain-containing protein [Caldisericia bacterium]